MNKNHTRYETMLEAFSQVENPYERVAMCGGLLQKQATKLRAKAHGGSKRVQGEAEAMEYAAQLVTALFQSLTESAALKPPAAPEAPKSLIEVVSG